MRRGEERRGEERRGEESGLGAESGAVELAWSLERGSLELAMHITTHHKLLRG